MVEANPEPSAQLDSTLTYVRGCGHRIFGIDLGTCTSAIGYIDEDTGNHIQIKNVDSQQGIDTLPSVVAFKQAEDGSIDIKVGTEALQIATMNTKNYIYDAKRIIGMLYDDPQVQEAKKLWPFRVVKHRRNGCQFELDVNGGMKYFPEKISSIILNKLKSAVKNQLNEELKYAVVTVPTYFSNAQKEATKNACKIADIEAVQLLQEPTAAAIAYGLDNSDDTVSKNCLVFDFGGGTFDVTVLTLRGKNIDVKGCHGDIYLGGQDIDNAMMKFVIEQIKEEHGVDLSGDDKALTKIRKECKTQKHLFLSDTAIVIEIENVGGIDFVEIDMDIEKFHELIDPIIQKTLPVVDKALSNAQLDKSEIEEIILVGGSTRILRVRELIKGYFGGKELNLQMNPDEAVSKGAAILAGIIQGIERAPPMTIKDIVPMSLGLLGPSDAMEFIIEKNTPIPCEKSETFYTASNNQEVFDIIVYQGESQLASENIELNRMQLTGIPRNKKYEEELTVVFKVDSSGLLTVTASSNSNKNSTVALSITQEKMNQMSEEEINQA